MYSVLPSPPQPTFAGTSAGLIVPKCLPSGENTHTPPGPVAHTLPLLSTFNPSGNPSAFSAVTSAKTRPFTRVPSGITPYRIQSFRLASEFATYKVFSSGDNAIPFGRLSSFASACNFPSASR